MGFVPKKMVNAGLAIGEKATAFIPLVGPTIKYARKAKQISDKADPISSTSYGYGIGIMFDYCFGPTGPKTVECFLWFTLSTTGGVTANLFLIATGAEFGNLVLEEYVK